MAEQIISTLRDLPSVEELVTLKQLSSDLARVPRPAAVGIVRQVLESFRTTLREGDKKVTLTSICSAVRKEVGVLVSQEITRVINATGIIVHTNLGRAPLSERIFDDIKNAVVGYGNIEFDLTRGVRGKRGQACEQYLAMLAQAEAATVVNNCAAGLFITLNTLANRKEVLLSRGELVQIGGGFRIPDILRKSGAKLVEVGTTNITTIDDYRAAVTEKTGLILKVHKSNFVQAGFTEEVPLAELVALGREHSIPVMNDLGSGVFVDTRPLFGYTEPTVQQSVRAGANITCFSGDKLLGGTQAGLLVGRQEFISRIKKNPIFRTVRVDKITFSIIEKLLRVYLGEAEADSIPLWQLATVPESELYRRGRKLLAEVGNPPNVSVEATKVYIGGGALPQSEIPSVGIVFGPEYGASRLLSTFRRLNPPVIGHVANDRCILDLKAIGVDDLPLLQKAVVDVLQRQKPGRKGT